MNNKKFKAIFFDKDGVLTDSSKVIFTAFNKTLKFYGKDELSWDEFIAKVWGVELTKNVERIFPDLPREKIIEIANHYRKERRNNTEHIKIYPSTIEVLDILKRRNYRMAVVTSISTELAKELLEKLNLLKYFDAVVGGNLTEPKPSPEPILKTCEMLGVQSKDVLFVGDTDSDISAGKAAGCTTAIVTTTKTREDLEKISDIIVIDDLKDILKIV